MDLSKIRDMASQRRMREEAEALGRTEADAAADAKRLEFQNGQNEGHLREGIERLKKTKEEIAGIAAKIEQYAPAFEELRTQKDAHEQNIAGIYAKIEGVLQDPHIQQELEGMGKKIQTAEDLVQDVDFAEDSGVSEAIAAKEALREVEQQLALLAAAERELLAEVSATLRLEVDIKDSGAAKETIKQVIEKQLELIQADIDALEIHAPEGFEKLEKQAEDSLGKKIESAYSVFGTTLKDDIENNFRSRSFIYGLDLSSEKAALGDEKFEAAVKREYKKSLHVFAGEYKNYTGLAKWESDFKKIDSYGEQLRGIESELNGLEVEKESLQDEVAKFLQTEEGRPVILAIIEENERSRLAHLRDRPARIDFEKEVQGRVARMKELLPERIHVWAGEYANKFVEELSQAVNGYVSDKEHSRQSNGIASISSELRDVIYAASENARRGEYGILPNPRDISGAVEEVKDFYGRVRGVLKNPEAVLALQDITRVIQNSFVLGDSYSMVSVRYAVDKANQMTSVWGDLSGGFSEKNAENLKQFAELMPKFETKKIQRLTFEVPYFTNKDSNTKAERENRRRDVTALEKYVKELEPFVELKAEFDIAKYELKQFEGSQEMSIVQKHRQLKEKQKTAESLIPELIKISGKASVSRNVGVQKRYYANTVEVSIRDPEMDALEETSKTQKKTLEDLKKRLEALTSSGRPSIFSGKRGMWDEEVAMLNTQIPALEVQIQTTQNQLAGLLPSSDMVYRLQTLINKIAKELPEDFDSLQVGQQSTTHDIYEKIAGLTSQISSDRLTPEELESVKKYEQLDARVALLASRTNQMPVRRSW